MNNLKAFVLLAGMTAVIGMVGQAVGGQGGMLIALLIAATMIFYMYFSSSTKVMKAYKAQTITREQAPELYHIVDKLRQRAGLPMPTVGIAPQRQPNAFCCTDCASQPTLRFQRLVEIILDPPVDRGKGCSSASNSCLDGRLEHQIR